MSHDLAITIKGINHTHLAFFSCRQAYSIGTTTIKPLFSNKLGSARDGSQS